MYRTHTCGSLRAANVNETVTLAGWVQKVRNLGAMTFIDLRDRYGITQIVVEEHSPEQTRNIAAALGREYVIQVKGRVIERASKNPKMPTGDIEVAADSIVAPVVHTSSISKYVFSASTSPITSYALLACISRSAAFTPTCTVSTARAKIRSHFHPRRFAKPLANVRV